MTDQTMKAIALQMRHENPMWSIEAIANTIRRKYGKRPTMPTIRAWFRQTEAA